MLSSLCAFAWLAGCAAQSPRPETVPVVRDQWTGQYGGTAQPSDRVVRGAGDWSALWQQLGCEAPRPLAVRTEMAVAVFIGERRTGGYRAEVVGTRLDGGNILIEYRELAPAPDQMVTQALTSPWLVLVLPASERPVVVRKVPAPEAGRRAR